MEKPLGKEAVKKAIIEATVPLVAARGVINVTFREIAQAANVNHGLITRYFGTKEELMQEVGVHVAQSMFQSTKGRGETLLSLWDQGFAEFSVQIKAMIRIMLELDPDPKGFPKVEQSFVDDVLKWLQKSMGDLGYDDSIDVNVSLYLLAAVLIGSEIIGPHVSKVLGLSENGLRDLRPKAFRTLLDETHGLFKAPSPTNTTP